MRVGVTLHKVYRSVENYGLSTKPMSLASTMSSLGDVDSKMNALTSVAKGLQIRVFRTIVSLLRYSKASKHWFCDQLLLGIVFTS